MSNFLFLYPMWLIGILPWVAMSLWLYKRQHTQSLIAPHLVKALGIQAKQASTLKCTCIALFGMVAFVALAGPSWQQVEKPTFTSSNARVLVLDMSLSMYANDIQPNRLSQLRYKAMDLLKQWQEGSTGLVVYSGDAYLVSPLTRDTNTLVSLIPHLSPAIMPFQGANAISGVNVAIETLRNAGLNQGDIIVFSDDIDETEMNGIIALTEDSPWRLTLLGVGTAAGAPIQLPDGQWLTSATGKTVIAKTNFDSMADVARLGGGIFSAIQPNNSDIQAIAAFTNNLNQTEKSADSNRLSDHLNGGYWLTLLLVIPTLLMFRRGGLLALLISLPMVMPSAPAQANPFFTADQQAYQQYEQEEYQHAASQFNDPRWKGIAQYQAGDFDSAIKTFEGLEDIGSQYNLANAYAQAERYEEAIAQYQKVLDEDPDNIDAKGSLEIVRRAQQQQQQQQQQQNSDNNQQSQQS
ncbi:VWA domain-containing protein, partial [Vibrio renipiscarius]|uniref:VWA domain-containing protein n=1 Tax=Vibrio renipiscarius TaxID=1461322 RepID=UPI00354D24D4